MKLATVTLKSTSPYSQSKYYQTPKLDREIPKDYEARTWRDRLHVGEDGYVFIPPMAIKNCLSETAKFMSIQIPGKGKATYTKHFEAGVMVLDGIKLDVKKEDVQGQWLFVPADGRRGSGKRVEKCFPVIPEWDGVVKAYVLDEILTEDVVREHFVKGGQFVGIGAFRPRNNGYFGRFRVEKMVWGDA